MKDEFVKEKYINDKFGLFCLRCRISPTVQKHIALQRPQLFILLTFHITHSLLLIYSSLSYGYVLPAIGIFIL